MIDKIIDQLVEQFNTQLGPESSADDKLGLVTNVSLDNIYTTCPNRTLSIVEGPMTPQDFEVGLFQPATWLYEPIELQLICKGTEKAAKETRRKFVSAIRQAIYNSTTRTALIGMENVEGNETERVLKYNLMKIRTDFAASKNLFFFIAVFQLSITTEISVA